MSHLAPPTLDNQAVEQISEEGRPIQELSLPTGDTWRAVSVANLLHGSLLSMVQSVSCQTENGNRISISNFT
jgi:hypothetical protein